MVERTFQRDEESIIKDWKYNISKKINLLIIFPGGDKSITILLCREVGKNNRFKPMETAFQLHNKKAFPQFKVQTMI